MRILRVFWSRGHFSVRGRPLSRKCALRRAPPPALMVEAKKRGSMGEAAIRFVARRFTTPVIGLLPKVEGAAEVRHRMTGR